MDSMDSMDGKLRNNLTGFDVNDSQKTEFDGYSFTQKHVFSTKNNPMCGVTLYQWLHIIIPRYAFIHI